MNDTNRRGTATIALLSAILYAGCVAPAKGDWESTYTTEGDRDTFTLEDDQEGRGRWHSLRDGACDVAVQLEEVDDGWRLQVDAEGDCEGESATLECELEDLGTLNCDGGKNFRNLDQ